MQIESALDTVLDRTIAPGYSRIGYALRSRGWSGVPRLDGRTAAVTGATAGIGLACALGLAKLGAAVVLLVRDSGRGERARASIVDRVPGASVGVERCDLGVLDSVRECAGRLVERGEPVDVLVNNAGVMEAERRLSVD